jgi:hypothetical protein
MPIFIFHRIENFQSAQVKIPVIVVIHKKIIGKGHVQVMLPRLGLDRQDERCPIFVIQVGLGQEDAIQSYQEERANAPGLRSLDPEAQEAPVLGVKMNLAFSIF